MMKNSKAYPKKFLVAGLAVLIAAIAAIAYCGSRLDQISISQDFAQQQVSQLLPITKSISVLPLVSADLTVHDIQVAFLDDSQLSITATGSLASSVGGAEIEIKAIGVPEFHGDERAFFFKPSNIEFTKFDFSPKTEASVVSAGEVAKGIIETQLKGRGAEKLKSLASSIGGAATEKAVSDKIEQAKIRAEQIKPEDIAEKIKLSSIGLVGDALSAYLNRCPIKKLDGVKGTIISLAVESISIDHDNLVIEFSLLKLTGTLLLYATLAILLAAAFMTAPFWAQFVIVLSPYT